MEDQEKRDILESAAMVLGTCFNWTMFRPGEVERPDDPIIFMGCDEYRRLMQERPDTQRLLLLMEAMTVAVNIKLKGHPIYSDPIVASKGVTEAVRRSEGEGEGRIIPFPSSR